MFSGAKASFSLLHPSSQIYKSPEAFKFSHKLVVPNQPHVMLLLTVPLFNFVIKLFAETLSITSVQNTCEALWRCHGIKEKFLSANIYIRKMLTSYGNLFLRSLVQTQHENFIHTNCTSLSCDHTYKYVKKLCVSVEDSLSEKKNL